MTKNKISYKLISLILALSMAVTYLSTTMVSFANNLEKENNNSQSETININGINYKYEYYTYDQQQVTKIVNLDNNNVDVISYNQIDGTITLNGEQFGYINNMQTSNPVTPLKSDNGWRFHDRSKIHISWAKGASVAVVAGAIASVIPGAGAGSIILKIGFNALSTIASMSVGGDIIVDTYTQVLMSGKIQFRYDWTFVASTGDKYGPFSSYQL